MISTTTLKTVSPRRGVGKGTKMTDLERAGRQGDSSVGMVDAVGEPEPRSFFTARTSVSGEIQTKMAQEIRSDFF